MQVWTGEEKQFQKKTNNIFGLLIHVEKKI